MILAEDCFTLLEVQVEEVTLLTIKLLMFLK